MFVHGGHGGLILPCFTNPAVISAPAKQVWNVTTLLFHLICPHSASAGRKKLALRNTPVAEYYVSDISTFFFMKWEKSPQPRVLKSTIGIYELKHVSLNAREGTSTSSCWEKGTLLRWACRVIYKEQGMRMLSQAKKGQQEEAQGK